MDIGKFPGSRGLALAAAIHFPPAAAKDTPCLIMCHGFRGGKDGGGRAVAMAHKASQMGIIVLRFDFTGTGESEGSFQDVTLSAYIEDLSAAVDFAGTLTGGRVIVMGRSFGGTTAICTAAIDERIKALCTWAAPTDLAATFTEPARPLLAGREDVIRIPEGNGSYLLNRRFFADLARHDVEAAAARIKARPVLVIHGTADETVTFTQGVKLYEALGGPKQKLFIQGGDHRFLRHFPLAERATLDFIRDNSDFLAGT